MPNKDHLSNEINLDLSLSEKGVSGKAKLRSLAAFDRLLGSLIDVPASKLETISNRARAQSLQEVKLIESEASIARNMLESDKNISRLVGEHYIQRQMGIAANKASVVRQSIEYLAEANSNVSGNEDSTFEDTQLDDDWLNNFEKYAEQASSERMRDLWARVLAGEIRKPQSFSLSTLRFLSELDKDIATLFEREAKHRLSKGFILQPNKDEMKGEKLLDLTFLQEVGLLQEVTSGFEMTLKPENNGVVLLFEGDLTLVVESRNELKLKVIRITRVGQEIVRILPPPNYAEVLERIEERIHRSVQSSKISRMSINEENGAMTWETVRNLKQKST